MFNAAIFWASVGGWGGVLFIAGAGLFAIYVILYEEKPVLAFAISAPVALTGIAGIALSLALTNAWEFPG